MSNGTIERMHLTLKNRIKKIFYESQVTLETAVDMVMFDIRSTPHAVTGVTPFSRFFGRPMRTKLTILKVDPAHVTCAGRDMEKEYREIRGRCVKYSKNDLVFFRKGKGAFKHEGKVVAELGNHAFLIETERGYRRVYNQRELKPRFHISRDDLSKQEASEAAYTLASQASQDAANELRQRERE